jgi:MFS family permease
MGKNRVLIAAIRGSSVKFVDATAVNDSLPIMKRDLLANSAQVQWVVGGSLDGVLGRKKMFVLAFLMFAITSGVCAIAPTIVLLIVARCVQGVDGALAFPESLVLFSATFTGAEHGEAIGTWSGFTSITGATTNTHDSGRFVARHNTVRSIVTRLNENDAVA